MSEKQNEDECDLTKAIIEATSAIENKIENKAVGKHKKGFPRELAPASEDYVRD